MTDHKEYKPKPQTQKSSKKSKLNSYAKFSGIAFQMVVIIFLGSYGGVKLDEKYPNQYSAYTIICGLASIAISIYFIITQVNNISKK